MDISDAVSACSQDPPAEALGAFVAVPGMEVALQRAMV